MKTIRGWIRSLRSIVTLEALALFALVVSSLSTLSIVVDNGRYIKEQAKVNVDETVELARVLAELRQLQEIVGTSCFTLKKR